MSELVPVLMVQGTASCVGKSTLVAGVVSHAVPRRAYVSRLSKSRTCPTTRPSAKKVAKLAELSSHRGVADAKRCGRQKRASRGFSKLGMRDRV